MNEKERCMLDMYSTNLSLMTGQSKSKTRRLLKKALGDLKKEMELGARRYGISAEKALYATDQGDFYLEILKDDTISISNEFKKTVIEEVSLGAIEDDVREYFNQTPFERSYLNWLEQKIRGIALNDVIDKTGCNNHTAIGVVCKMFPMYKSSTPPEFLPYIENLPEDNRVLPDSLKPRIDSWRINKSKEEWKDQEALTNSMLGYMSFNALVRDELRKGNIPNERTYSLADIEQESVSPESKEIPDRHPWRRYFARSAVDLFLLGVMPTILIAIVLAVFIPQIANIGIVGFGVIMFSFWILIEAFLLNAASTTPGKWLFSIYVRDSKGGNLSFSQAFSRTIYVAVAGLGLGIPFIALFTCIFGYSRLTKTGTTLWDKHAGSEVVHKDITVLKEVIGVIVVIAIYVILFLLNLVPDN